jgi:TrmH family RNA methyltransferase
MEHSGRRNVGKLIRDLQRRKARERRGLVLAEGRRLVEDALGAGAPVVALLVAEDAAEAEGAGRLIALATERRADVEFVPRKAFDELANTETPTGMLAVVEWEPLALDRLPDPASGAQAHGRTGAPGTVALVLDAVQDPGNVGTMIRTAHALGAWCTIALDGTADVRGPKVLRGAMGSHFRHPVAEADWDGFQTWAARENVATYVAAADGAPADTVRRSAGPSALVVGSEGHGVREAWSGFEHRRIAVPMRGDAESLNAAVAAGILLHELLRAR